MNTHILTLCPVPQVCALQKLQLGRSAQTPCSALHKPGFLYFMQDISVVASKRLAYPAYASSLHTIIRVCLTTHSQALNFVNLTHM